MLWVSCPGVRELSVLRKLSAPLTFSFMGKIQFHQLRSSCLQENGQIIVILNVQGCYWIVRGKWGSALQDASNYKHCVYLRAGIQLADKQKPSLFYSTEENWYNYAPPYYGVHSRCLNGLLDIGQIQTTNTGPLHPLLLLLDLLSGTVGLQKWECLQDSESLGSQDQVTEAGLSKTLLVIR